MLSQWPFRSITLITVRGRTRKIPSNLIGKSSLPSNCFLEIIFLSLIDYIKYFKLVIFFSQLVSLVKCFYQIRIELLVFAEQFEILCEIYLCSSRNRCVFRNYELRNFCGPQYLYNLRRDFSGWYYRAFPRLYFCLFIFLLYIFFFNTFHFNYD